MHGRIDALNKYSLNLHTAMRGPRECMQQATELKYDTPPYGGVVHRSPIATAVVTAALGSEGCGKAVCECVAEQV